jgi:Putative prokaryotic signal transducing protein
MSAEADDREQSHEELVEVFDTMEESEAMVVRGLLESAGIEAIITAWDAPQDILPGVGGVKVRVASEQAEEARSLIEDYRNNSPEPDEDEVNDDSAA